MERRGGVEGTTGTHRSHGTRGHSCLHWMNLGRDHTIPPEIHSTTRSPFKKLGQFNHRGCESESEQKKRGVQHENSPFFSLSLSLLLLQRRIEWRNIMTWLK